MKTKLPDPDSLQIPRIESDRQYAALLEQQAALEKRLTEARERRQRAEAVQRGVKPGRSPLARAADLLRGGTVPALDPPKEIAAADHEAHVILRPAIMELSERLESLRADLAIAVCRKLAPLHTDALRAAFRAMQDVNTAFAVATGIRARIRAAGYGEPSESLLPWYVPSGAAILGDGVVDGKQLVLWKNLLEQRGVKID
jgi:Xaa-Pro aminopeptidase